MNSSEEKDSEKESLEPAADEDVAPVESDDAEGEDVTSEAVDKLGVPDEQQRGSKLGIVTIGVLVLLAGALGGLAGFFAAQSGLSDAPAGSSAAVENRLGPIDQSISTLSGEVTKLSERVTQLDAGLADLSDRPAVEPIEPIDLSPFETAITALQSRVDDLDAAFTDVKAAAGQGSVGSDMALLDGLSQSIDALRTSIGVLETELPNRISALESSIVPADLESRLQNFSTQSQYDALAARLSLLESNPSGEFAKQAALALGLANLVRAVELGQSFEAELETLAALAPSRKELAVLRPLSAQGLKPSDRLSAEFADLARRAILKDKEVPDAPWWQQILQRMRSLVTIRPVGDIEGITIEAVIARAELHMNEGDLKSAVAELRQLDGAGAVVLQDWLGEAEAHLQAQDLLKDLSAQILRDLGQLKG